MRSARLSAAEMFCSTTTIVWPASASARQVANRSRTMIGASPSNGSSSSTIFGVADQRASDREHLLLAARKIGAAAAPALAQARENRPDPLQRPPRFCREPGQHQVFLDGEAAEDAAVLRHELQSECGDRMRRQPIDRHTVEHDPTGARANRTHQALQRRALARAVAAEQCDDFALLDPQRDVEQNMAIAIEGC